MIMFELNSVVFSRQIIVHLLLLRPFDICITPKLASLIKDYRGIFVYVFSSLA